MVELNATDIHIRRAAQHDALILSDITWRSKGYWGYNEEFLRDCGELLNIKASYIKYAIVYVAEVANRISGFYGLSTDNNEPELGYLQVEPEFIGKGVGKLLWHHAISQAKSQGWKSFKIQAEPLSEPFFMHMGAVKIAEHQSQLRENLFIPILSYTV